MKPLLKVILVEARGEFPFERSVSGLDCADRAIALLSDYSEKEKARQAIVEAALNIQVDDTVSTELMQALANYKSILAAEAAQKANGR